MASRLHPSRFVRLQEPAEPMEATPELGRRVSGSNCVPLGRRSAQSQQPSTGDSSEAQPDPTSLPRATMFNQRPLPDRPERLFQSLFKGSDIELVDYLRHRHVSVRFLHEIDLVLRNNPGISRYSPEWTKSFNSRRPLDAYKFFVKGYTKPARYIDGYLPDVDLFVLSQFYIPARLTNTYDEELVEFFEGQQFRHDILQDIDRIVDDLCYKIQCGMFVKHSDRKLVSYALWGNPVDAYKYYEYSYQTEWLQHRYLPEHIEMGRIPKPVDYTLPSASVLGPDEGHRSHSIIRMRMARANDNGVDVLDVLVGHFVRRLASQGHRRAYIEMMKRKAQHALDVERNHSQGRDIVDMIMDMAETEPCAEQYGDSNRRASTVAEHNHGPTTKYHAEQCGDSNRRVSTVAEHNHGPTTKYKTTPGGLFTIPDNGSFIDPALNKPVSGANGQVKIETQSAPSRQQKNAPQPKDLNAQPVKSLKQLAKKDAIMKSRKDAYMGAMSRLKKTMATQYKDECKALKERGAAVRGFAMSLLAVHKKAKHMTTDEVGYLKKMSLCSYDQDSGPELSNLLERYGSLFT